MVTLAIIGAGLRGMSYARRALESGMARVVAVAEPDPERRRSMAAAHDVPAENVFADWRDLLARDRLADAAVISTQDSMHTEPAVRAADLGYHLLLEKPMAQSEEEAAAIAAAADRNDVLLAVCHVMRYTPYTIRLRELIAEGRIGEVMNIQHLEQVGWWHQAHSFVRGNWRSEEGSGPMLMTKACPRPRLDHPCQGRAARAGVLVRQSGALPGREPARRRGGALRGVPGGVHLPVLCQAHLPRLPR
ncbi:Gfo/Idh/MocA family protein [Streptomyces sp. WC2508]|uniref:Gfo/Idh/MocA family protein n=1 Tax=Streptomyces sp. WC2508 TaxID=3461405 RepID=UPI004044974E